MNNQIRRLGTALLVCYLAVFAMLNYVQVFEASSLNDHPENNRQILRDFTQPRGTIESADGALLARSVEVGGRFERVREYPEGELFAHVTGFFSFDFGATGVEKEYNDELAGQTAGQEIRSIADLFVDRVNVGDVTLTVRRDVQQVARDQLGEREGAVVALDAATGEVLALWSHPSYDPNLLSNHDLAAVRDVRNLLVALDPSPLRAAAYQEREFPGSTFKAVTAGAGLESGRVTPDTPSYPVTSEYTPPQTSRPIRNFGGSSCGGRLFEILSDSCNTAFAEMGTETLGPDIMVAGAERFGFNSTPPIDLPAAVESVFPTDFTNDLPKLAQSSIGQNDVQATTLQMALVASAAINGGVIMQPQVMAEIRDSDGDVIERADPAPWLTALGPDAAAVLREAMVGVVNGGTATGLAIPGVEVGGKTGTAQFGTEPPSSHAWILGFATAPDGRQVAVAVLVEGQPGVSEQTGGRVAAPIARAVLEAALTAPEPVTDIPLEGE